MPSTGWIVLAVVVVLVVLLIVWLVSQARGRQALRERFGPEYDRAVAQTGSETRAQHELRKREQRHDALSIRSLTPQQRERYSSAWDHVQTQFVDDPVGALGGARGLVERVMADRGYPTGDVEQQAADLSVEHASVLGHYRAAHAVPISPSSTTEQLREAMVHYRALFAALLGEQPAASAAEPRRDR